MNRITIRRFDIVRTANMVAAFYLLLALIFGLFFILPFVLIGGIAGSRTSDGGGALLVGGLVAGLVIYLFIVLFYAVVGWVFGAIGAAVYNFLAGRIGGFQLDVTLEGPSGGGYPQGGYPAPAYAAPYPAPSSGYPPGYVAPGHGTGPAWPQGGPPAAPQG